MVTQINNKDDLISKLNEAGDQLVVIDFYAIWCGSCAMISPKLEELAEEFKNVFFFKIDVDECEDIVMEFNIATLPTFVFFKNNEIIIQLVGAYYDNLRDLVMKNSMLVNNELENSLLENIEVENHVLEEN